MIGLDTTQPPAGLESLCILPGPFVADVTMYGAKADGISDDTVAIRSAIATVYTKGGGIVYFPTGTYAVCMQNGDIPSLKFFPTIFELRQGNITFLGDGPDKTIIKGYMPGLTDPFTHWTVTGDSYFKIIRFGMFRLLSYTAINNVQFWGLTLDGGLPYTGNNLVGGNPTTGDGWDMSHKAIAADGAKVIDNVLIFDCLIQNWHGEQIWTSGMIHRLNIIKPKLRGCNASVISSSSDLLIANAFIGGPNPGDDVYNGVENFDTGIPQRTVIQDSTIQCSSTVTKKHGNGVVYLGVQACSLSISRTNFLNNVNGILLDETAHNVLIQDNTFLNHIIAVMDAILGLYPQYPTGFSNVLLEGNSATNSGALYGSQANFAGYKNYTDLVLRENLVGAGTTLIQGPCNGPGWTGFLSEGNTIGPLGQDTHGVQGNVALWIETIRLIGSIPNRYNDTSFGNLTSTIYPTSDLLVLDYNHNKLLVQNVRIDPTKLINYPVGFFTVLKSGAMPNWQILPDPTWNTLTVATPITPTGVKLQKNVNGLFDLVS